jgi:hypothetical protein
MPPQDAAKKRREEKRRKIRPHHHNLLLSAVRHCRRARCRLGLGLRRRPAVCLGGGGRRRRGRRRRLTRRLRQQEKAVAEALDRVLEGQGAEARRGGGAALAAGVRVVRRRVLGRDPRHRRLRGGAEAHLVPARRAPLLHVRRVFVS